MELYHVISGVATVKLNKKPVNSLNLEFLDELVSTIDSLEKDEGCRGVILTSVGVNQL